MNKGEFLQGLKEALSGEVPPAVIQENLKFYDDYIRTEHQNGRSEAQILEELGSPRLIARTIIEATPGAGEGGFEPYRDTAPPPPFQTFKDQNEERRSGIHFYDLSKWYWKLLGIVVMIAVLTLVLSLVAGLLSLVISMLPVIAVVCLVMYLVRGRK